MLGHKNVNKYILYSLGALKHDGQIKIVYI